MTAGLMQIGWADQSFVLGDPEVLEGVGDVPGSWAYDGARQLCWSEEERDYGQNWKVKF